MHLAHALKDWKSKMDADEKYNHNVTENVCTASNWSWKVSEHKLENNSCYIYDKSDEQICFGIVPWEKNPAHHFNFAHIRYKRCNSATMPVMQIYSRPILWDKFICVNVANY